jgi:hypothetical protein
MLTVVERRILENQNEIMLAIIRTNREPFNYAWKPLHAAIRSTDKIIKEDDRMIELEMERTQLLNKYINDHSEELNGSR